MSFDWLAASPLPWLPAEIAYLALSLVLLGVHIAVQAILLTVVFGSAYNSSPRDEQLKPGGVAGRAERALRNFNETFPAFAVLVLAVTLLGKADWWSGLGAAVYFWSRVVYLPLYLGGVHHWRSAAFIVAAAGLVILFFRLVS